MNDGNPKSATDDRQWPAGATGLRMDTRLPAWCTERPVVPLAIHRGYMTVVKNESQEPAGELPGAGDYFVLETPFSSWYLSVEMARAVDRDLTATPLPEWTVFVDLAGARVRLRTSRIEALGQCTAEQRAACREFNRRLKREHDASRGWDEED